MAYTLPFHPSLSIHDKHFSVASRIRLGLPPVDDLKSCSCRTSLRANPLHFLDCRILRSLTTVRHDRLLHTLARIARSAGIAVMVEPRLGKDDLKRTDANFYFSSCGTEIDVSVVHPSSASFFKLACKPLGAAQERENRKNQMYLKRTQNKGSAFYPVVFESYGASGSRARDFIRLLNDEASTNGIHKLQGLSGPTS